MRRTTALLDSLDARGVLGNTLVVICSDHGEHLGEHGLASHGGSRYRSVLHVPLVMALPGRVPAGRRESAVVSLRDVARTVLDLAGMPPTLPGSSLGALWQVSGAPVSPGSSPA